SQSELRQQISQTEQDVESLKLEAKRATSIEEVQKAAVRQNMVAMPPAEHVSAGEVAGASTLALPTPTPTPKVSAPVGAQ
ncbi:MAG: hypothetical protein WCG94_07080, partial [Methanothrix sp.]